MASRGANERHPANNQFIDEKDALISELMRRNQTLERDLAAKNSRIAKLETTLREQISKAKQMKENFLQRARSDRGIRQQQNRMIKKLLKERALIQGKLAESSTHSEMEVIVGGYEAELAHQFSALDGLSKRYHELLTYIELAISSGHLPVSFDIKQFYFC